MTHDLKPVIYVAGRFSDGGTASRPTQAYRREILRGFSAEFMRRGWAVICPIENDEWAFDRGYVTYDDVMKSDLAILKKCDVVFFCADWELGVGTVVEHKFAEEHGIKILYEEHLKFYGSWDPPASKLEG